MSFYCIRLQAKPVDSKSGSGPFQLCILPRKKGWRANSVVIADPLVDPEAKLEADCDASQG